MCDLTRTLERERDEAREQRDAVTLRLGETQERMIDAERQRDRLAEALKNLVESCDCIDSVDFMPASMPEAFEKAQQALQSLTP
jgi:anaerobic glycerol-3-phosphate dehydrogenase